MPAILPLLGSVVGWFVWTLHFTLVSMPWVLFMGSVLILDLVYVYALIHAMPPSAAPRVKHLHHFCLYLCFRRHTAFYAFCLPAMQPPPPIYHVPCLPSFYTATCATLLLPSLDYLGLQVPLYLVLPWFPTLAARL